MEKNTSSETTASISGTPQQCLVYDVGRQSYSRMFELQLDLHARCKSREIPNAIVLVEHNPVITLGVTTDPQNVLFSRSRLEKIGVEIFKIDRGGDATYHGPGQIVGYPIVNLKENGNDVHRYLRLIEEVVIKTLADFGLTGRRNGPAGVWVGEKKICSIGIAVRGGVTYHGFALNVCPNLEHFYYINPCGLRSEQISSMEHITGKTVDTASVKESILAHFSGLFNFDLVQTHIQL